MNRYLVLIYDDPLIDLPIDGIPSSDPDYYLFDNMKQVREFCDHIDYIARHHFDRTHIITEVYRCIKVD